MTISTKLANKSTLTERSNQQVDALVREYEAANQLGYNRQAQIQLHVIGCICQIGTQYAFKQISQLIIHGSNHEYMNDAIPDLLSKAWQPSYSNHHIANTLIQGMLHGQTEVMKCMCTEKLVAARYVQAYPTLLAYRNTLLLEESFEASESNRLFNSVVNGIIRLASCVDAPINVADEVLWSRQPLHDFNGHPESSWA